MVQTALVISRLGADKIIVSPLLRLNIASQLSIDAPPLLPEHGNHLSFPNFFVLDIGLLVLRCL